MPSRSNGESGTIAQLRDAFRARAVRAAEYAPVGLHAVADDPTAAMRARRRERMNRAFEAVKRVRRASHANFERLVVVVSAYLADGHIAHSSFLRSIGS
jgi:hypothetical protein